MDTLFTALRVAVSLALIIGLIWFVQRRSAKWSRKRSKRPITVIGRQSLGGKSRVVIVEADGTHFVLGVTDSSVVVLKSRELDTFADALAELELEQAERVEPTPGVEPASTPEPTPTFAQAITSPDTWRRAAQSLRTPR
ncbi:flagellar biosynthetic protein FliO [Leifsonia shinshuensis]|uniref:Flagellar protein n=1 Tax=Leifsonia shinshuensis TaxID=150026 RepID=A0A7G6YCQ9_9MICO|nr:flagellar biosynthetic protein FliO [Leifsonia shinshuensis]QNE36274.1 flagellar biosynthetic protein FliO [Leifsonia shinshuensis]